ncbi:MAG: TetR/AcrR family transcriptional regulator [bacterium]
MDKEKCDKKEIIFNSTLKLITENGFDATPISLIAKDAGVASGTIYIYFKDKRTLINELYLQLKEQLTFAVINGYSKNLSIRVALELMYRNYLSFMLQNKPKFRFFEQFTSSPYIDKLTKEEGLRIFYPVIEIFEKAKRELIIKNIPNEIIYAQVFSPLSNLIRQQINGQFKFDEKTIEITFQVCWDAIKS